MRATSPGGRTSTTGRPRPRTAPTTTTRRPARRRRTGRPPGRRSGARTLSSVAQAEASPRGGPGRRLSTWLYRHPRARLAALLALPLGWLVIVYFGSLLVLL